MPFEWANLMSNCENELEDSCVPFGGREEEGEEEEEARRANLRRGIESRISHTF